MMRKIILSLLLLAMGSSFAQKNSEDSINRYFIQEYNKEIANYKERIAFHAPRSNQLAEAARSLEKPNVIFDPSYVKIDYPNGDISEDRGVSTDIIIRAFRKAWDWDLQKMVYEFQKDQFPERIIDRNIDHRRVRNLMELFDVYFDMVQVYNIHNDRFKKGNIVIWDFGNEQLQIAICVDDNMIIHNNGHGQVIEPMYAKDKVIRNYTFEPDWMRSWVKEITARRDSIAALIKK